MVLRGEIKGGMLVSEAPVGLPEGARVLIEVKLLADDEIHPEVLRVSGIIPPFEDYQRMYHESRASEGE